MITLQKLYFNKQTVHLICMQLANHELFRFGHIFSCTQNNMWIAARKKLKCKMCHKLMGSMCRFIHWLDSLNCPKSLASHWWNAALLQMFAFLLVEMVAN